MLDKEAATLATCEKEAGWCSVKIAGILGVASAPQSHMDPVQAAAFLTATLSHVCTSCAKTACHSSGVAHARQQTQQPNDSTSPGTSIATLPSSRAGRNACGESAFRFGCHSPDSLQGQLSRRHNVQLPARHPNPATCGALPRGKLRLHRQPKFPLSILR